MIIYTAVTGGYDGLKTPQTEDRYIAFSNTNKLGWERYPITADFGDDNRTAKWYKLHPHILFPDDEISLWVDGSVLPLLPLERLVDRFMTTNWCVHKHSCRNSIREEAAACKELGKDDPLVIDAHLLKMTDHEDNTLYENGVILRRHHDPIVVRTNELWWQHILTGSRRDQLSFPYVAAKTGLEICEFPGSVWSSKFFKVSPHA